MVKKRLQHLPPEADDIDRAEQDEEQGQLDPGETDRHGESSRSAAEGVKAATDCVFTEDGASAGAHLPPALRPGAS